MAFREKKETSQEKRAYQRPSLTKYGQLKHLTAGGSAGAPEGNSNSPSKQRP